MSDRKDYYKILGVTEEEKKLPEKEFNEAIKKKFRKLSLEHHPDKYSDATDEVKKMHEDKFKEVAEAYETLSDANKRQQYDLGPTMGGFDPWNPFSSGFNPFDPFGGMGGGMGNSSRVYKGDDINVRVKVTLEDVLNGPRKKVKYTKKVDCPHCHVEQCQTCHGTGTKVTIQSNGFITQQFMTTCPDCGGTGYRRTGYCSACGNKGYTEEEVVEEIDIPRGVEDGMAIRIEGLGNAPVGVAHIDGVKMSGSLNVIFNVVQHPEFERQGSNLIKDVKLSLYEAWTGCDKEIMALDGSTVRIRIPELTEDGKMFSIKGKGLPSLSSIGTVSPNGNMYVRVRYKVPKSSLNKKQRKALEEFCNLLDQS